MLLRLNSSLFFAPWRLCGKSLPERKNYSSPPNKNLGILDPHNQD